MCTAYRSGRRIDFYCGILEMSERLESPHRAEYKGNDMLFRLARSGSILLCAVNPGRVPPRRT